MILSFVYDLHDYDLYDPYCTVLTWAFHYDPSMIAMILLHSESVSIYDLYYYYYCVVQTWAFMIIITSMMLLWSLWSLLHCVNMDVYDPYYIYDPSDYDLYNAYCTVKTWKFMILITSTTFWSWSLWSLLHSANIGISIMIHTTSMTLLWLLWSYCTVKA